MSRLSDTSFSIRTWQQYELNLLTGEYVIAQYLWVERTRRRSQQLYHFAEGGWHRWHPFTRYVPPDGSVGRWEKVTREEDCRGLQHWLTKAVENGGHYVETR